MIAHIEGTLISAAPTCVVKVGGVGFELQIPEKDRELLDSASSDVAFHTYLYVREDRLTLFGFLKREDRELFTRVIEVSGIGPRIALNMLAQHPTSRIVSAIKEKDHGFLCKLPGLGRKTAERLTMELKDKLDAFVSTPSATASPGNAELREEAILALVTLGMTRGSAEKALEHVNWRSAETLDVADIVKTALRRVSNA
jgi:Holliday junction DNA helicase RuvA